MGAGQVLCPLLSLATIGIGVAAIYVGFRNEAGGMAAKVGGSVVTVIGLLGLISCLLTS